MDEEPLTQNEINSELTGLNKGQIDPKKKLLIMGIAGGALILIILIIIIIVVATRTDDGDNKDNPNPNPKPSNTVIGEINCIFDIKTTSRLTQILGKEFEVKQDVFDMNIDGVPIRN